MGWPDEKTPLFYVHNRICVVCGYEFKGYSSNKYCSENCKESAFRKRMLAKWGMGFDSER